MADFNLITPRLATGAAIGSPEDVQALVDAGITFVIDCRNDFDDAPLLAAHPDLLYLWNGTADDGTHKDSSWFKASIDFALPQFAKPGKCYAHCAAGVNRGPSTAYCLMRVLGFSSQDAEALIRAARPQVQLAYKNDADEAVNALGFGA